MTTLPRTMYAVAAAAAALAAISIDCSAQPKPSAGSAPVTIVGPLPVPVTGNVQVTNSVFGVAPKKPSDIRTVFHGSESTTACDFAEFDTAVGADGNSAPFAIPSGRVFVITELEAFQSGVGTKGGFIPFSISGTTSHHGTVPSFTGQNIRFVISPLPVKGTICSGINPSGGSVVLHGFLTEDN